MVLILLEPSSTTEGFRESLDGSGRTCNLAARNSREGELFVGLPLEDARTTAITHDGPALVEIVADTLLV